MNTKKRILPALLLSLFAGVAAPAASAAQFTGVYVFGDSLSDAGYYRGFLASLGLPAPVVAQLGRFTTNPGPVWSELVSQFYGFTPTADKERRDDVRHVSATPLTMLAVGSTYDIPVYRPDTSYVTGAIGVNGLLMPNVGVSVAYYKVESRSGTKEDGIQGLVSIRF